ncbi:tetraspanin-31-like isoform X2 [Mytilus galloprovincialis]|uniref:tetraspanin-31-like isoform X2 n=1 Tax=Mytilus galloprovincialis TaxID=29158 RepID=UPI003F7B3D44
MVCGGFSCSKNALAALNVLYFIVALILIGVSAYSKVVSIIVSLSLVGGVIASGVFLMLIAIIGYLGAVKHHQVLLFFYMVILFLLFLFQFSIACACLAVNAEQRSYFANQAWTAASEKSLTAVQTKYDCCGYSDPIKYPHPSCVKLACCAGNNQTDPVCSPNFKPNETLTYSGICKPCESEMKEAIHTAFSSTGGVGLFFSFTEIIGVMIAMRYRNLKDPSANPNAFL